VVFLTCCSKIYQSFAKRVVTIFGLPGLFFCGVAGAQQIENTVAVAIPISWAIRRNVHAAWFHRPRIFERKEPVISVLSQVLVLRIGGPEVGELGNIGERAEAGESVLERLGPGLIEVGGFLAIVVGYSSYVHDMLDF